MIALKDFDKYPCWLTNQQLKEAQALITLGFEYCGKAEDYMHGDEYVVGSTGKWKFSWSEDCEIALDAVCDGALYSWNFDHLPDSEYPQNEEDHEKWFDEKFLIAKVAIQRVEQDTTNFTQMSLF